jgi:hypothetical protein
MASTVIGRMEHIDEAQRLVQDLMAVGFAREDIGLRGEGLPGTAALNESEGEDRHANAIVVAVAAGTRERARDAAAIMQRHGAEGIDEA